MNPGFLKKFFLQKLDNKNTVRMQSRFLELVENWIFGSKITKMQVSDVNLNFSAILLISKSKVGFFS
jgi:hypothetical protein